MSDQEARQRLEKHLDEHPSDLDTRRIYADLLESLGEDKLAEGQRWQAAQGRWPHHYQATVGEFPWVWTCEGGLRECLPHAGLARPLCQALGFREWTAFADRADAEDALAEALPRIAECRGRGGRGMMGFWSNGPCMACGQPWPTPDPAQRMCPDCREDMLETLAVALDRGYDRTRLNDGEDLWRALWRLYGDPRRKR
jgi:hypothetical protein